jgi:pimeloyl-ACP methyl ester carboxylesterase
LGWFRNEGALEKVSIPNLMMIVERDEITPSFHAEFLLKGIINPEQIVHKIIENADHFSFLSPFPAKMRGLFHQELKSDVLHFLLS